MPVNPMIEELERALATDAENAGQSMHRLAPPLLIKHADSLLAAARRWQRIVEAGDEVVEVAARAIHPAAFAKSGREGDRKRGCTIARAVLAGLREGEG